MAAGQPGSRSRARSIAPRARTCSPPGSASRTHWRRPLWRARPAAGRRGVTRRIVVDGGPFSDAGRRSPWGGVLPGALGLAVLPRRTAPPLCRTRKERGWSAHGASQRTEPSVWEDEGEDCAGAATDETRGTTSARARSSSCSPASPPAAGRRTLSSRRPPRRGSGEARAGGSACGARRPCGDARGGGSPTIRGRSRSG